MGLVETWFDDFPHQGEEKVNDSCSTDRQSLPSSPERHPKLLTPSAKNIGISILTGRSD